MLHFTYYLHPLYRRVRRARVWGSFRQRTQERRAAAAYVFAAPFALVCSRCGFGLVVKAGPLAYCYCPPATHV